MSVAGHAVHERARNFAATPFSHTLSLGAPAFVLLAAVLMQGAGDAALAALLSAALLSCLIARLLTADRALVGAVLRENRVSLAAAGGFIALATFSALPLNSGLSHPFWASVGLDRGAAISISPYRTWEGLTALAAPIAAYALGAIAISSREDRDRAGKLVIAIGAIVAAFALAEHALDGARPDIRLDAGLGSPNAAATLFGALTILNAAAFARAATAKAGRLAALMAAPLAVSAFVLTASCLLLTASRAGIAATFAALLLFAFLNGRQQGSSRAPLVIVLALLTYAGAQFALDRLDVLNPLMDGRLVMIDTHWRAFLDRPWLGHGLNSFHEINSVYATSENWSALRGIGATHNVFLQMLEETGVIGAALFAVMLTPPLYRAWRRMADARLGAAWSAAILACFALALVHGFVDFGLQVPATAALLAFFLGAFSRNAPANDDMLRTRSVMPPATAAALMLCGALIVFDAAASTRAALQLAETSRMTQTSSMHAATLSRAETTLTDAWSRPLLWHAGALEAHSWILALRAEAEGNRALLQQSADTAERGVALAPVQSSAWTRLAALSGAEISASCEGLRCLENSWRAAPMTEAADACARIELASALGERFSANDVRLRNYAAAGPEPEALTRCLATATPETLFPLLLQSRQARAR